MSVVSAPPWRSAVAPLNTFAFERLHIIFSNASLHNLKPFGYVDLSQYLIRLRSDLENIGQIRKIQFNDSNVLFTTWYDATQSQHQYGFFEVLDSKILLFRNKTNKKTRVFLLCSKTHKILKWNIHHHIIPEPNLFAPCFRVLTPTHRSVISFTSCFATQKLFIHWPHQTPVQISNF